MPSISKFSISNFRGIQSAEIVLDGKHKSDVITLIGLNESGKTTVLEALSHFSTGDRTIPNLLTSVKGKEHYQSLIPVEDKPAFTGEIRIEAAVSISRADQGRYINMAREKFGVDIEYASPPDTMKVSKVFSYKDSEYIKFMNYWSGLEIRTKTKKSKKYATYTRPKEHAQDIWLFIINKIEAEIFEIVYFPTFLVDFPARIYLEEIDDETDVNVYYRSVISHVAKYADNRLDIDTHIIKRVKDVKSKTLGTAWPSSLYSGSEKGLIDAVVSKIEGALNKEIIGSWSKVFKGPSTNRSIKVEWGVDAQKADAVYLSLFISDGSSRYAIEERSLGFRWFFSYLLFTQFRASNNKPTIFLFDEPAANLHAKAQTELLNSMRKIVSGNSKVIYSTHSPHMINPLWLEGAYIVENKAIDLDSAEDMYSFDVKPTDIKITRYPEFLNIADNKTSYFQPIVERLMYSSPPIIGVGPYCLFEGISDFHAFSYERQISAKDKGNKHDFDIMPGLGAGAFEAAVASLISAGKNFLVVLDDDAEGRKEKKRYIEERILRDQQVVTYGDLDPRCIGMKLEDVILKSSKQIIQKKYAGKSGKKQIKHHLAEISATGSEEGLHPETLAILASLRGAIREKIVL